MAAEALVLIYERAYFARMYGRLGDSEWARYDSSICSQFASRVVESMKRSQRLTAEFLQYIEDCTPPE
jgi:hypothetical protein